MLVSRSFLLGGLVHEGVLVQPVGNVAVEGARLHGHAVHASECPVGDVEGLQHPEAWGGKTKQKMSHVECMEKEIVKMSANSIQDKLMCTFYIY